MEALRDIATIQRTNGSLVQHSHNSFFISSDLESTVIFDHGEINEK